MQVKKHSGSGRAKQVQISSPFLTTFTYITDFFPTCAVTCVESEDDIDLRWQQPTFSLCILMWVFYITVNAD